MKKLIEVLFLDREYGDMSIGKIILWMSVIFIALIATLIFLAIKSSCVSARIFNEQNNTHYSCSDFYWAGDQINVQTQTIKLK